MFKQSKKIALSIMIFVSFSNSGVIYRDDMISFSFNNKIEQDGEMSIPVTVGKIKDRKKLFSIDTFYSDMGGKLEFFRPKLLNVDSDKELEVIVVYREIIPYNKDLNHEGYFYTVFIYDDILHIQNNKLVKLNKKTALFGEYSLDGRFAENESSSPLVKNNKINYKFIEKILEKNKSFYQSLKNLKAKKNLKTYNKAFFEKLLFEKPIGKIKSQKEILISELLGGELISIMRQGNSNKINNYLKFREEQLPKLKKMTIIKLLNNVEKLSHPMYYKKGDIYSEEIINRGENIVPELIELIMDDKNVSKVSYTDKYHYFIGDLAARFIHEINQNKMILHNYLWDEFKLEGTFLPNLSASSYGNKIIFNNDNLDSKKNRILLYKYIKEKKYDRPNAKYNLQNKSDAISNHP